MMRNIHLYISAAALLCLVSCSEIKFGDKFLGDRPESSGADIDTMFNSAVNVVLLFIANSVSRKYSETSLF